MSVRRTGGILAGVVAGFAAGAVLTLALQGAARMPEQAGIDSPSVPPLIAAPLGADTFLVWAAGGLSEGFADVLAAVPGVRRVVVVASDNTWLTRSYASDGAVVDDPPGGFAIPLEVAAVRHGEFAPFLPPADRGVAVALATGQGILGESSARLRGLGPGAVLRFGRVRVEVAAILPDELVGAHELLVSRSVGRRIGVTTDRYAVFVAEGDPSARALEKELRRRLPAGTLLRVRGAGDTRYFRQADAVLPPVKIKELFGEFAARQRSGSGPAFLTLDPVWVRTHITTERVPLLGEVTCNVALFPQIRGAIAEVIELGLEHTITSYSGCWAPRHMLRDPGEGISHHAWGIGIDVNVPQNFFGDPPNQDPRLVEVFERWGFIWGGTFIRPDGMHFEYRRPPEPS